MSAHKQINTQRSGQASHHCRSTLSYCLYLCRQSHPPAPSLKDKSSCRSRSCWCTDPPDTAYCPRIHSHLRWRTHKNIQASLACHTLTSCKAFRNISHKRCNCCVFTIVGHTTVELMTWKWSQRICELRLQQQSAIPHLRTQIRWMKPRSLGHRPCRRRSPVYWCKHLWGTHLESGTHQCLKNSRRQWG